MIYTEAEIEAEVSRLSGTWVRRRNASARMKKESNAHIVNEINEIKKQIRNLKAMGFYQSDFIGMYSEITKLELKIL